MSKSSNRILSLLVIALLAACQTTPPPEPEPAPVSIKQGVEAEAIETVTEAEPVDLDQVLYEQALQVLKEGDAEAALIVLERLSVDAPDKPYLFTNLGLAYFRLERSDEAEIAFVEAIERDAGDAVAYNHLGILQRRKGEFQAALDQYRRALEIDAEYAGAHLNLGILFDLYLQDLEMALQHYQVYRSLNADDNPQLDGWIVDIERRLKTAAS